MALNFEIIFNMDAPMLDANDTYKQWTVDEIVEICNSHNCKYIMAPHVPDEMSAFNHIHCGIHTSSDNTFDTIAKWFNLKSNSVQKIRGRFDSTYALYLIHFNQPNKTPVEPEKVISNFAINYSKLISNVNSAKRLDEILENIDKGVIKEYNYTKHISAYEYIKYQRQIERAFNYRKDSLKGIDRKMECVFIQGGSGVGKTTYAKQIASDRKMTPYISSGSNDVLDDYKGEECIILDDLRPSCIALSDLLKMLDNNTASSVKSRFKNKVLECKLIIITTTLEIDKFFAQVFQSEDETKIQLMRRCGVYIKMTKEDISLYSYNSKLEKYEFMGSLPNHISMKFNFDNMSDEEKLNSVVSILGGGAEMLNNLKEHIASSNTIENFALDNSIKF